MCKDLRIVSGLRVMIFLHIPVHLWVLCSGCCLLFPHTVSPDAAPPLPTPKDDLALCVEVVRDPVSAHIEPHLASTALPIPVSLDHHRSDLTWARNSSPSIQLPWSCGRDFIFGQKSSSILPRPLNLLFYRLREVDAMHANKGRYLDKSTKKFHTFSWQK